MLHCFCTLVNKKNRVGIIVIILVCHIRKVNNKKDKMEGNKIMVIVAINSPYLRLNKHTCINIWFY